MPLTYRRSDATFVLSLAQSRKGFISICERGYGNAEDITGRPRLDFELFPIWESVLHNRQVMAAARELGCSDFYIHVKLMESRLKT